MSRSLPGNVGLPAHIFLTRENDLAPSQTASKTADLALPRLAAQAVLSMLAQPLRGTVEIDWAFSLSRDRQLS
jgi:hypothetical protein